MEPVKKVIDITKVKVEQAHLLRCPVFVISFRSVHREQNERRSQDMTDKLWFVHFSNLKQLFNLI